MKKALVIASILLVAVVSTACINNIAVRDLNNKAQEYMAKGEYGEAIEHLKSSIDLDSTVFESHYNLGIAYTQNEDYINAEKEFQKSLEIKPNTADVFYSLATAQNNLAADIEQGTVRLNTDGTLYKPKADEVDFSQKYKMNEQEQKYAQDYTQAAIANYQKYLELKPNAKDKDKVQKQIEDLTNPPKAEAMEE